MIIIARNLLIIYEQHRFQTNRDAQKKHLLKKFEKSCMHAFLHVFILLNKMCENRMLMRGGKVKHKKHKTLSLCLCVCVWRLHILIIK